MESLKPGDIVLIAGKSCSIVGVIVKGEVAQDHGPSATKSASAHMAMHPKFGAGYDAIFGPNRRKISREEAQMN